MAGRLLRTLLHKRCLRTLLHKRCLSHHIGAMDDPRSTRVHLMMSASELEALDEWRRAQPDLPSRAEAIRRLIDLGLAARPAKPTR